MTIKDYLRIMLEKNGSDIFFRAGANVRIRVDGQVLAVDDKIITLEEVDKAVNELTSNELKDYFKRTLDADFGIYIPEFNRRFRVSIFMQRNWPALVIRNITPDISTFEELHLPPLPLQQLCSASRGLVLLTGSMGSGKSTTIASMIEYINQNFRKHILTLEEPVEFTYCDKQSIINQRELGIDVSTYAMGLRALTLQSPDVLYIANIRDTETMAAAITAAETGILVLSTLHTVNASQSIERIINFFPPHQHHEIKMRLSYLLKGVISLRLVPMKDKPGRLPACEVMLLTPTINRLIKEDNIADISKYIEEGAMFGMQSFTQSLIHLVKEGLISQENAMYYCDNQDQFMLAIKGIRTA